MKSRKWLLLSLCTLGVWLAQGCATPDKSLSVKNFEAIPEMKTVRYESPRLMKKSAGTDAVGMTGIMFGAVGGALGGAISAGIEAQGGKTLVRSCGLPDFGKLVMDKLAARIPEELPGLPKLSIEDKPADSEPVNESGYTLVIRVTYLTVRDGSGLETHTTAKMLGPERNRGRPSRFRI
jgi:hypothetical protein